MSDPNTPPPKPSSAKSPAAQPRSTARSPADDKPKPSRPKRSASSALAVLALLLALLALAVAAYVGWQWRQTRQARSDAAQATAQLHQQVAVLRQDLKALRKHDGGQLEQVQSQWQSRAQAMQDQWAGLDQRTSRLEHAVSRMAQDRVAGGRHALLLDQAQLLLRMASQRYELFHDGAGALRAYAMADEALAAADDPALAGVRQTVRSERAALAASKPDTREKNLQQLANLRGMISNLPLQQARQTSTQPVQGFWPRLKQALAGVVVVQRTDGNSRRMAASGMARQLTELDLAQAEAASLAYDDTAMRSALKRADQALQAWFDTADSRVGNVREGIHQLLSEPVTKPVKLGAALQQLQDVRGMQRIQRMDEKPAVESSAQAPATPASVTPAPASAASIGGATT